MATPLTRHFALEEFTASVTARDKGIDNTPDEAAVVAITRLARTLEVVRALISDVPITITLGFRCPELNAAVGGASNSARLDGLGPTSWRRTAACRTRSASRSGSTSRRCRSTS